MVALFDRDSTVWSLIQAQRGFEVKTYLRDNIPTLKIAIVLGATLMAGLDDATPRVEATRMEMQNSNL